jgi:hypothetical protein
MDTAEHRMSLAIITRRTWAQFIQPWVDTDAKVNLGMPYQRHQTDESELRIGLTIHTDDKFTAAAEQFVNGHILDMAAVREIQPSCLFDISNPIISRSRQTNPGTLNQLLLPGRAIQKPRRTFRNVSKAVSERIEPNPICEENAAPEMAIAVAASTGREPLIFHWLVGEYPVSAEPQKCFEKGRNHTGDPGAQGFEWTAD